MSADLPDLFALSLKQMPIVSILRGVRPEEVLEIAQSLIDLKLTIIEVPLNSPQPLKSIELLVKEFGETAIIGAGTVLTIDQVKAVSDVGGKLVVSPNCNEGVIAMTKTRGMISTPGVLSPTEAFKAIDSGADALKFFPGNLLNPDVVKAYSAVLPNEIPIIVTGGVNSENISAYVELGVRGFGIGSNIYKAGDTPETVRKKGLEILKQL